MSKRIASACLTVAAFAVAAPAFAAAPAASAPVAGPVTAVDVVSVRAVVERINLATRELTLRGEAGNVVDLVVGPEVKNLDKVRVGDTVTATHTMAIAARIATKDEAKTMAAISATGQPQKDGRLGVGAEITERLKIVAVDTKTNTVTFTDLAGTTETVAVKDPAVQARLRALKPGDEVFVTYSESVAVALTPTGAR